MTPYDECKSGYYKSGESKRFEEALEHYLDNGFVFSTPTYFIAGIEMRIEEKDCWYVWWAAGDLSKMWDCLPYQLGYIAFERTLDGKRDLRILPIESLRRLSRSEPITHETVFTD